MRWFFHTSNSVAVCTNVESTGSNDANPVVIHRHRIFSPIHTADTVPSTNLLTITMHELHRGLNIPILLPTQLQNTNFQRHVGNRLQVPRRILRRYSINEFIIVLRVHRRDLFPADRPTNDFNMHPMPRRIRMPQHIHLTGAVPGRKLLVVDDADINLSSLHAVPRWVVRKQHGTVESAFAVV